MLESQQVCEHRHTHTWVGTRARGAALLRQQDRMEVAERGQVQAAAGDEQIDPLKTFILTMICL